jgi:hypothetical protein
MTEEEQTFVQKFKSPPSKVDKTHKIVIRHVEDRGGVCPRKRIEGETGEISNRTH